MDNELSKCSSKVGCNDDKDDDDDDDDDVVLVGDVIEREHVVDERTKEWTRQSQTACCKSVQKKHRGIRVITRPVRVKVRKKGGKRNRKEEEISKE